MLSRRVERDGPRLERWRLDNTLQQARVSELREQWRKAQGKNLALGRSIRAVWRRSAVSFEDVGELFCWVALLGGAAGFAFAIFSAGAR